MAHDWDDLRFFLAVARTKSLSEAAALLHVSQPTVGRRLRELESRLGARLLERTGEGYVLTAPGTSIVALAEEIERSFAAIDRRIAGADSRLEGRVRLTATAGLARTWLIPRLKELAERHPGLELDLHIGMSMADLLRRQADVALRFGDPGSGELVGRRLGRVSCGLYAARSYLQVRGTPRSLAELSRHDLIESTGDIEQLVQARRLRRAGRGAHVRLRCDDVDTQVAAARAGFGIVPLMTYMRTGAPELVRVLAASFDLELDLWLLTHADLRDNARVRAVLDFLFEAWAADAPRLADRH